MTGTSISIELDDAQAQQMLARLIERGQDMSVLMSDVGSYLELSTDRRFFSERQSPDGTPWAPVSAAYARRKQAGEAAGKGRGGKSDPGAILHLIGDLVGTLRFQLLGAAELEFGSDREYAATHQFGDPSRNIPARPFLGISDADAKEITRIMRGYPAAR